MAEYAKACRDELKYGCVFATLSKDSDIGCRIRFNSPATAAACWNGEKGRIDYGFPSSTLHRMNLLLMSGIHPL